MTKFSLYYGVLRSSGELEMIALKDRGQLGPMKDQLKSDIAKADICKKYSFLVIATDYGVHKRFKTPEVKEAPKKKSKKKEEK
jgi:hypothetical protein